MNSHNSYFFFLKSGNKILFHIFFVLKIETLQWKVSGLFFQRQPGQMSQILHKDLLRQSDKPEEKIYYPSMK